MRSLAFSDVKFTGEYSGLRVPPFRRMIMFARNSVLL